MEEKLYTWDQTINEVRIIFPIDNQQKSNIKYQIKGQDIKIICDDNVILDGKLLKKIQVSSEYWLKNDDNVEFLITKRQNDWWDSLLEGEDKIDVSALAEKSNVDFSMLDPEARQLVEKMVYENKKNEDYNQLAKDMVAEDNETTEQ